MLSDVHTPTPRALSSPKYFTHTPTHPEEWSNYWNNTFESLAKWTMTNANWHINWLVEHVKQQTNMKKETPERQVRERGFKDGRVYTTVQAETCFIFILCTETLLSLKPEKLTTHFVALVWNYLTWCFICCSQEVSRFKKKKNKPNIILIMNYFSFGKFSQLVAACAKIYPLLVLFYAFMHVTQK